MTEVFNKRYFEDYLNNIKCSARNFEGSMAVLILDVDYFKLYNDCYGHLDGDICLKKSRRCSNLEAKAMIITAEIYKLGR